MRHNCDAAKQTSQGSKAKKLHIYPFMADVMLVEKDLSAQRRWKALIQQEGKEKNRENIDEPYKKLQTMFLSFRQAKDKL